MLISVATLPLYALTEIMARLGSLLGGRHLEKRIRGWVYGSLDTSDQTLTTP
jgi:hypothetical protein